jgi:two-component system NtrC family response regulator
VLIRGESGSGKELVARAVHHASPRADRPMLSVNCAAIPESLLDAELFGHDSGAPGKIELSQGGTLFLDEVADIPLTLQVKLLKFLQERRIERQGGPCIPVDVRIVCATHQDLEEMIVAGAFREDLYYRLAEIVVRIPSLKDRPGDPALLARHFLNRFAKEMNPQVKGLAPDALAALDAWNWPGNDRVRPRRVELWLVRRQLELARAGVVSH